MRIKRTLGLGLIILFLMVDMSYSQMPEEHFKRGVGYGSQEKFREAYREFRGALTADRFYYPARSGIKLIEDVMLQRVKKEVGVHLFTGMAHLTKGMWDDAILECEKALAVTSQIALEYRTQRDDYKRKEMWGEFIAESKKVSALNFEFVLAHETLGRAYGHKGMWDAAIAEYKKAIDIDFKFVLAREALGDVYERKGMWDAAIAEYKKAIDVDPNFVLARESLGGVYERKGMWDAAIAEYKKAVDIDPDFVLGYEALGGVYEHKGMWDAAIAEYKKALAIDPNFVLAREALGRMYEREEMWDEARAEYKKAVDIDPDFVSARESLGRMYEREEMWDEAMGEYKETVALSPDFRDARYNLFAASAAKGDLSEVERLLEEGVSVNVRVSNGWTALTRASFYGHADIVKLLLASGAEVDITTCGGEILCAKTVQGGDPSVESMNTAGATPLVLAAQKGHLDIVRLLLDAGAEKDYKTKNGQTALSLAAQNDHYDVVQFLLEKGAEVNAPDMVLDNVVYPDVVKLLLDHGADIKAVDSSGETALNQAARDGNFAVVKLLLEKGADPNTVAPNGEAVLFQAAIFGKDKETVEILLDKGANANFKNKNRTGATVLHVLSTYSPREEDLNMMKVLIEKGADVNVRAKRGLTSWGAIFSRDIETPLGLAIRLRHPATVKLLLEKGATVSWIHWPWLFREKLVTKGENAGIYKEIWQLLVHSRAQQIIWGEQVILLIVTGYVFSWGLGRAVTVFKFLRSIFFEKLGETISNKFRQTPNESLVQKYNVGLLLMFGAILMVCFVPQFQENEEKVQQKHSNSLSKRKTQELRAQERMSKMNDMQKVMVQSRWNQVQDQIYSLRKTSADMQKTIIHSNKDRMSDLQRRHSVEAISSQEEDLVRRRKQLLGDLQDK